VQIFKIKFGETSIAVARSQLFRNYPLPGINYSMNPTGSFIRTNMLGFHYSGIDGPGQAICLLLKPVTYSVSLFA
jgi:hypothetical protein